MLSLHRKLQSFAAALAIAAIAAGEACAATLTPARCLQRHQWDKPAASLILDASGNLSSRAVDGGPNCPFPDGVGCRHGVRDRKTGSGYASAPTVLYSFCAQGGASCTDGAGPAAGLIADASGNLFGTTEIGGASKRAQCSRWSRPRAVTPALRPSSTASARSRTPGAGLCNRDDASQHPGLGECVSFLPVSGGAGHPPNPYAGNSGRGKQSGGPTRQCPPQRMH